MTTRDCARLIIIGIATAIAFFAVLFLKASITSAAKADRQAPTAPTNLMVTGVSETTVSLQWNGSTDNSGRFSYRVKITDLSNSNYNQLATVSQTTPSYTVKYLSNNTPFSFAVYAVDGAGNRSAESNPAGASTLADTSPPTTPALQATVLGPSQVQLTWTKSTDTGSSYCCAYSFNMNGSPLTQHINWTSAPTGMLSVIIRHLQPNTTNSFSVNAIDTTGKNSATSNIVSVKTLSTTDFTPPGTPTNLHVLGSNGCPEFFLGWNQVVDNAEAQSNIEYEIYVNGVLSSLPVSAGVDNDFVYAAFPGESTFTVKAVDKSGNTSGPSNAIKVGPC